MNRSIPDPRETGFLIVNVRAADNAYPLSGARVTVTGNDAQNGTFTRTLETNADGSTPLLALSVPQEAASLTPGNARPYATYNVRVLLDGYYVHENRGVPVFPGVTSIQPAEMIPLARFDSGAIVPGGNLSFSSGQVLNSEEGGND